MMTMGLLSQYYITGFWRFHILSFSLPRLLLLLLLSFFFACFLAILFYWLHNIELLACCLTTTTTKKHVYVYEHSFGEENERLQVLFVQKILGVFLYIYWITYFSDWCVVHIYVHIFIYDGLIYRLL